MQESEKGLLKNKNLFAVVMSVVCLILLVSLVAVLAYYSVVLRDKDSQIQTLAEQNTRLQLWLQENITYYSAQVNTLNEQLVKLRNESEYLNKTIEELRAPQLHEINFEWEKHEPAVGQHYVRVRGSIFNSGVYTAKNVQMHVWLYDEENALIGSQIIYLGDIPGKTYVSFDINIYYSGHCDRYEYRITYE